MRLWICAFLFAWSYVGHAYELYTIKIQQDEFGQRSLVSSSGKQTSESVPFRQTEYPQFIEEHTPIGKNKIIEIQSTDPRALDEWMKRHGVNRLVDDSDSIDADDEVRTLVNNGPSSNRIDLVFMGDGYTSEQRELFFSDIERLVQDMFVGKTFQSYLPLFNVHAVFRSSKKSGIGRGQAIDTAYGLYSEGETLRAIFPTKASAIRSSCKKAPGCDYPVVIANDPYYGGLGGEFAISTSSQTSGTTVLRHELGHNFGRVGEEYDGGGYFGANHSSDTNVGWSEWLDDFHIVDESMVARHLSWPWHNLKKGPFISRFQSDGLQGSTWIRFSASGIETPDTLQVKLDDQEVAFKSPNRLDRSFVNIQLPGLSKGSHTLSFVEKTPDQNNWISSLTVHEYGKSFDSSPLRVSAFPLFADDLSVDGYRPTNESCLMRDMEHEFFCPVCQENNWVQFFGNIRMIDGLVATKSEGALQVKLSTPSLGQFRPVGTEPVGESLEIKWFVDDVERPEWYGLREWQTDLNVKSIRVTVELRSLEIRKQKIRDSKSINL